MVIEKENKNGNLIVAPDGRLDSLTAGEFENLLNQEINDELKSLTVDLAKVDFVSSKGLRVLVGAYKKLSGRKMILNNANSSVMEVLKISGLLKIFSFNEQV